jgi:class 3 adenylate cyclase/tetratricopeptide (TPR) repeat protein
LKIWKRRATPEDCVARSVDDWLDGLGLSQYVALFAENEVDFEVLPDLTEQDLKDLQIPLGHRKKLLKGIAALNGGPKIDEDRSAISDRAGHTAAQSKGWAEAERRQLTVMFCDLVDSTSLSTRLDPEDLREVIRSYQEACSRIITRYGGYVAKYMGDGILVYFGYPQAHEDDCERAARASLDVIGTVDGSNSSSSFSPGIPVSVRIGISTGPVVVGDIVGEGAAEEASVVGETPNIAARLQALAQPNQVIISPLTRQLIGDTFAFEDLGEKLLKGIAKPAHAWRLVHERAIQKTSDVPRTGLPLIGRQEELGLLLRAWEASRSRHGQVVHIQGEAGIGKSRLVGALLAKAGETTDDHTVIVMQCSPFHGNSTLYPVIEHLKHVMDWKVQDTSDQRVSKLENVLRAQNLSLAEAVPLFAQLLGLPMSESRYPPLRLSGQELRERTLDILASWLFAEAEKKALLCLWEDVHWADSTTLDLLALCIEQSPTVPMMNMITFRSEFVPPWPVRSHMVPIILNRLERPEVEGMIRQQSKGKPLPAEVVDYIVSKADGVPLYVEELSKAVLETSFLREKEDRYELAGPLSSVTIPVTLQDLLMARLDRVPTVREIAQIGSILGREFAYEMIRAIAAHEEAILQNGLDQLVQAELLYQRGRRPHARYTFKHALVQDAAYESLLKRTRRYYHQQVGELLERRYPELAQSEPNLVAQHYVKAENDEKAAEYLVRAADKAAGLYAHTEAVAELEAALIHIDKLPTTEHRDRLIVEISLRLAESLHFLGRRKELVERLQQEQGRLDRLADASLSGKFYFWLGFAHSFLGHRSEAQQALGHALQKAAQSGDDTIGGRVHRALAMECTFSGQPLEKAVHHGHQAIELLEGKNDGFWLAQALFVLSYASYYKGDFELALNAAARLNALGERIGSRRARANAEMMIGLTQATRGDWAEGIEAEQRALDLSPDDFETAWILACLGKAYLEGGDATQAVRTLEQAIELADRVRSLQLRSWFRTMLGDAYVLKGELEKAYNVTAKAFEVSTEIQFLLGVGLSKQALGRIAYARGDMVRAKRDFHEAVTALHSVSAHFELAQTHLELATLAHTQGDSKNLQKQLKQANELFSVLEVPKHKKRVSQLAERFGVTFCVES